MDINNSIFCGLFFFISFLLFSSDDTQPKPNSYPDQFGLTSDSVGVAECATDLLAKIDMEEHPDHSIRWEMIEEQAYSYFTNPKLPTNEKTQLTIPVVIHIVRDGETGNVSDQAVIAGIQKLNAGFANSGNYFQGSGVDTDIRFCLAKQDPNGNPTNGINRIHSPLTNMDAEEDDLALKNLSRWDPTCYLNIWIVNRIEPGYAGYAYLPYLHGSDVDGVVVTSHVFSGNPDHATTLIHECGHYLGLLHTFEGGCKNDDCLSDGDRVCDTPPDQSPAWLNCNEQVNSCTTDTRSGLDFDQNDMLSNYLDYVQHQCRHDFTAGQKDRMQFFLTGARQSLLDCAGCLNPCPNPIAVEIIDSGNLSLQLGESISLQAVSANTDRLEWWIDGNLVGTGRELNFVAEQSGRVLIRLRGLSDDSNCLPQEDHVLVSVECPNYVQIEHPDGNVEIGQEIELIAKYDDAFEAVEWQLENGQILGTSDTLRHIFREEGFHVISLIAKSINTGCGNSKRLYVTSAHCSTGDLKITAPQTSILSGTEPVIFTAQNDYNRALRWYINEELVSTSDSFSYIFPSDGDFQVRLEGSDLGTSCGELVVEKGFTVLCFEGGRASIWELFPWEHIYVGEPYTFGATIQNLNLLEWWIGDQLVGDEESLEYIFDEPGVYEITLRGRDSTYACIQDEDTLTVEVEVNCSQRLSIQYESQSAKLFETITYTAFSEGVKDLQWFIDGELIGEGDTLSYTFNDLGVFRLRLRGSSVYDVCSSPSESWVDIFVSCPTQSVAILAPDSVAIGQEFEITADIEGPLELEWSIRSDRDRQIIGIGSSPDFTYVLNDPGIYRLSVTGRSIDYRCGQVNDSKEIIAHCPLPEVFEIISTADSVAVAQQLELRAEVEGQIAHLFWRVDGSVRGSGPNFTFHGETEGVKEVVLVGVSSYPSTYACNYFEKKMFITVYCPSFVEINESPDSIAVGESIELSASSSDVANITWSLNGTPVEATGERVIINFDTVGLYEIMAELSEGPAICRTDKVIIESYCPPISMPILLNELEVQVGQEVELSTPSAEWDSVIWFSNGEMIGEGPTISYTFADAGEYEILVTGIKASEACGMAVGTVSLTAACSQVGLVYYDRDPYVGEPFLIGLEIGQAWDSLRWYINGVPQAFHTPTFWYQAEEAGFYEFSVEVFSKGCKTRLGSGDVYTEVRNRCQFEERVGFRTWHGFGRIARMLGESEEGGFYLASDRGVMMLDGAFNTVWSSVHNLEFVAATQDIVNGGVVALAKPIQGNPGQSSLILKFSDAGELLWNKEFNGVSDLLTTNEKLIQQPDGSFIIMAAIDADEQFSVIYAITPEGNVSWSKFLAFSLAGDIVNDKFGNLTVVGRTPNEEGLTVVHLRPDGEILWSRVYEPEMIFDNPFNNFPLSPLINLLPNGNFAVAFSQVDATNTPVAHVAILREDGELLDVWQIDSDYDLTLEIVFGLQSLPNGDVLLATYRSDQQAQYEQVIYLTRINPHGEIIWQHRKDLIDGYIAKYFDLLSNGQIAIFGDNASKCYLRLLNQDGYPESCTFHSGYSFTVSRPFQSIEHAIVPEQGLEVQSQEYTFPLPASPYDVDPILREECVTQRIEAADLTVHLFAPEGCAENLSVSLQVCNMGNVGTSASTSLTFYSENPVESHLSPLKTVAVPAGLQADTCYQFEYVLNSLGNAAILYAMINDDGTSELPLDLLSLATNPDLSECNIMNNLDSIEVDLGAFQQIDLGPDLSICQGDSLTLAASPGFSEYAWTSTTNLSCEHCPNTTLYPTVSTQVAIQATSLAGCIYTDTLQVQVLEAIEVEEHIIPSCFLQSNGKIQLETIQDPSTYNIQWSNGESGNVLSDLAPGSYSYTLSDEGGCSLIREIQIEEYSAPRFDLDWQNPICLQEASGSITFTPISEGLSFSLDGEAYQSSGQFDQLKAGDYTAWIRDEYGCDVITHIQLVDPEPLVLEVPSSLLLAEGDTILIILGGQLERIETIQWAPSAGLSCTTCLSPLAYPDTDITYEVAVTDDQGCQTTYMISIQVDMVSASGNPQPWQNLQPPTAFSPNGDGVNDRFEILGLELFPKSSMVIVDRWGKIVFAADPFQNDWDGESLAGEILAEGAYYYSLDVKRGENSVMKGVIMLIR